MRKNKLGGLVEFLNFVVIYDDNTKTYTIYSPSYPKHQVIHADEVTGLELLKAELCELKLD